MRAPERQPMTATDAAARAGRHALITAQSLLGSSQPARGRRGRLYPSYRCRSGTLCGEADHRDHRHRGRGLDCQGARPTALDGGRTRRRTCDDRRGHAGRRSHQWARDRPCIRRYRDAARLVHRGRSLSGCRPASRAWHSSRSGLCWPRPSHFSSSAWKVSSCWRRCSGSAGARTASPTRQPDSCSNCPRRIRAGARQVGDAGRAFSHCPRHPRRLGAQPGWSRDSARCGGSTSRGR